MGGSSLCQCAKGSPQATSYNTRAFPLRFRWGGDFLCFYMPMENSFTTNARGTLSPIYAHGTVYENRALIYGFWLKYFTAHTHGVVRRIDEKIIEVNGMS